MKTRLLIIIVIAIAVFVSPLVWVDQAFASCAAVDYDLTLEESELVFTGTVTRLDNYDGPQKVTFFIHEVIKGEMDTPKYILENSGKIFLEDGSTRVSSVSVDYKIGKTYKVYVENGETNQCTTKITTPPDESLIPEPGPICPAGTTVKNGVCVIASTDCGEGTTYQDGMCVVDKIENSTKSSSDKWGKFANPEFTDEQICGEGDVLVGEICEVIITESGEHWPVSSFTDGLFFIIVILPFFVPGALIFIVVSKTPRFSKLTILSVIIPAIITILYFLSGLFLGWYPLGYA